MVSSLHLAHRFESAGRRFFVVVPEQSRDHVVDGSNVLLLLEGGFIFLENDREFVRIQELSPPDGKYLDVACHQAEANCGKCRTALT